MARSVWKGPFYDNAILNVIKRIQEKGSYFIKIRSRRSVILPQFIGYTFHVYNGKKYIPVKVNENMIGYKFGEFSPTRSFPGHSGNKKAVKK